MFHYSADGKFKINEKFGCPSGIACCLHGYYGKENRCSLCPKDRPSSPHPIGGAPDDACKCPNEEKKSCFSCTKCEKFNIKTRICESIPFCKA